MGMDCEGNGADYAEYAVQWMSSASVVPDMCGKCAGGDGGLCWSAGVYVPVCREVCKITGKRISRRIEGAGDCRFCRMTGHELL